jgi:hypothetical protein
VSPSPHRSAAVRVLVEGRSDAVVVEHLLRTHGLARARVEVMDGVTNIERELTRLAGAAPRAEVCGLFDAAEERFVRRALARRGVRAEGRTDLARAGFFACDADLEDELIRALGTKVVEDAVAELGELPRLRTFQRQPEWRGRTPAAQLRRFAGAGSGRKERLAAALAQRLTPATTPAPLARLIRYVGVSVTIERCPGDPAAR